MRRYTNLRLPLPLPIVMPRLHQDTCRPATCIPDEQLVSGYMTDTCRRIQVARPGYLLTVSRRHYYSFMSRSTCIPLYPATDWRQTGDNFVADTINMLTATSGYKWIQLVSGNMCSGVDAPLSTCCTYLLHLLCKMQSPQHCLHTWYLRSVSTTRVHGPSSRAENSARKLGCTF